MKLKPTEILKQLGLIVPEDGLEVGDDLYYHTSMLALLGSTLSVERISEEALNRRHEGLVGVGCGWGLSLPTTPAARSNPESAEQSRASISITLRQVYGFETE